MKRAIQEEEEEVYDNPTLPEEIIAVIVECIPFHWISTYQAFLCASRLGAWYISKPFYAFLESFLTDKEEDIVPNIMVRLLLDEWCRRFNDSEPICLLQYAVRCLFDKQWQSAIRISPFLALLRLAKRYHKYYVAPDYAGLGHPFDHILSKHIWLSRTCATLFYYDKETKIAVPLKNVEGLFALDASVEYLRSLFSNNTSPRYESAKATSEVKLPFIYQVLKKKLALRKVRNTDTMQQLVYNDALLLDEKNEAFRNQCFSFTGPAENATVAYQIQSGSETVSLFEYKHPETFEQRPHNQYTRAVLAAIKGNEGMGPAYRQLFVHLQ